MQNRIRRNSIEKKDLQPTSVFRQFAKINEIPRPSKREGKMTEYLREFGKSYQPETSVDETGNVIIHKLTTKDYEDRATVILQNHMDMVCDKLVDAEFNFDKNAIQTYIDDEWPTVKGTTPGVDDGIGVTMELAMLESDDIEYSPTEYTFIVDEEAQLTGVLGIKAGLMMGDYFISLNPEDEGKIYVSYAGDRGTIVTFDYKEEEVPEDYLFIQISLKGLVGDHSGDDIDKKRANAIEVSTRLLSNEQERSDLRLASFSSGKLHNTIPRDGKVVFAAPSDVKEQVCADWNVFQRDMIQEFHVTDINTVFNTESTESQQVLPKDVSGKPILALRAVDDGIFVICQDELLANMVETSSNVAAMKTTDSKTEILSSQRNDMMSNLDDTCNTVRAVYQLADAEIEQADDYPAWNMNPDSKLVKLTVDAYRKLFDKESEVLGIHVGLEHGLFSERYPHIDVVSFGLILHLVHTPNECLHIPTIQVV